MKKPKILIADDDHDTADTLAQLLRLQGFETQVAYDGKATMEQAIEFQSDVFILGIKMPSLDGFEVARRLRAIPQFERKLFVALSGFSDHDHLDEAARVRFDQYLVKPCKMDLLMAVLREAQAE